MYREIHVLSSGWYDENEEPPVQSSIWFKEKMNNINNQMQEMPRITHEQKARRGESGRASVSWAVDCTEWEWKWELKLLFFFLLKTKKEDESTSKRFIRVNHHNIQT